MIRIIPSEPSIPLVQRTAWDQSGALEGGDGCDGGVGDTGDGPATYGVVEAAQLVLEVAGVE